MPKNEKLTKILFLIIFYDNSQIFKFVHDIKGGDTSRTFKKSKIFFLLKSIEKLFKNINIHQHS